MPTQQCPNCQAVHDVGVYVTGQRVRCHCGIHFQVRRTDVSTVGTARATGTFVPRGASVVRNVVQASAFQPEIVIETGDPEPAPAVPDTGVSPPPAEPPDRTFISQTARVKIPGYELHEILGKGGMGEVWLALQQSLGRMVAVKLLPPKLAQDPEFIARFEKEATALAALNHPNIIQIIDRGVSNEHYFFVMEYVQGRSLRDFINEARIPPPRALKIISEVCAAIGYAHDQQIIHRDLKPENILIDTRGHVKVADFGLAGMKSSDKRLQLTATSVAMGTINYMAPEQRRDAKNVDGRADLFSVGVMLYELLTGEIPVGRFDLPSAKVPGLDPRLDEIVEKALAQDPEQRFASASIVGQAVEEVLSRMQSSGPMAALAPLGVDPVRPPATVPGRMGVVAQASSTSDSRTSVIQSSWKGLQLGLLTIGAIAVVGFGIKFFGAKKDGKSLLMETSGLNVLLDESKKAPPKTFPPNTFGEMFSTVSESEGGARLTLGFDVGDEEINAHAGTWRLENGVLSAVQAGNQTGGQKLIPRAYLAHRYFSSDDFTAEVEMRLRSVGPEFANEEDGQRFGELAFRIRDLQVSVFAIPGAGMRLMWRYYTSDGIEQIGNSAKDVEFLVEDEMPVPPEGEPIRVRLSLKGKRNGTEVEAFANGNRFVKKFLPGLESQIGKVALGCRNQRCQFDDLKISGKPAERPGRRSE